MVFDKADREKRAESPDQDKAPSDDDLDDIKWSIDPENPRNWNKSRKWISVAVVRSILL